MVLVLVCICELSFTQFSHIFVHRVYLEMVFSHYERFSG